jgi:hypothetical protein
MHGAIMGISKRKIWFYRGLFYTQGYFYVK